jgi:threonine aldolase
MGMFWLQGRIDLRSDTVTKPTAEMRKSMAEAEVGDDVYGEDPTVVRLQELAARMLGKEAALFVTSGTQGNQVAIATHARSGEEIIAEAEAHIFYYEAAAVSAIAGAQIRQVPGARGILEANLVKHAIRESNVHHPKTALISIENTHNRAGGTVWPLAKLRELRAVADEFGIPVHMDGARLMNASVALGVAPSEIAQYVDTVQICLSKGLCAPVGSLIVGSRSFIDKALQWRKRLGGGMRQAGVIAAPGIIALTKMVDRLSVDHENAKKLADALLNMKGISIHGGRVETNIVIADIADTGLSVPDFLDNLKSVGILASSFGGTLVRFVTHHDVSADDIEYAIAKMAHILSAVAK